MERIRRWRFDCLQSKGSRIEVKTFFFIKKGTIIGGLKEKQKEQGNHKKLSYPNFEIQITK